jgi:predicted adenylyl cyclase CyaB
MSEWIEVEIKAHVDSLQDIESRLPPDAKPLDTIDFRDTYYTKGQIDHYTFERFRLREFNGRAVVTAKERIGEGESASAREYEFEVSDARAFQALIRIFGFEVFIEKRKAGKRFQVLPLVAGSASRAATVELIHIDGLGDFVEIEVLVEKESEIELAERMVRTVMSNLGIGEDAIEPRPYTYMLYESKRGIKDQP